MSPAVARTTQFCERFGVKVPILLAPMAGVSAPALSIAVAAAGGFGACGAVLMRAEQILAWIDQVRAHGNGAVNLNLWVPDPPPRRDPGHESSLRQFLAAWGPPVAPEAADATPPNFEAQCAALLRARPPIVSSVMGLFAPQFVTRLKALGIAWFANVSTLAEARAAAAAGADAIVAQGMEAGGHRGCFQAAMAERQLVGLMALVPAIVDAVRVPVVASGAIADGRGVAAALALGASAVQIGTGFLRCPEADIHPAWAQALAAAAPEDTIISRVFSGRAGRSLATGYVLAALSATAPAPAPYPVQRGLTAGLRADAVLRGDVQRMQAWAGQACQRARAEPAGELVRRFWSQAQELLA